MRFAPSDLRGALDAMPPGVWSLPSSFAATGVHHGYRRVVLVEAGRPLEHADPFGEVLDVFDPVWSAWLSWIDPGGFIVAHRDSGPYRERWQVPIITAGTMDGRVAVDGEPFMVRHWEFHRVDNPTDRPRVHLVIDRDVMLDVPPAPFATA